MILTAEQLRAVLAYDPATGVFTRRSDGRAVGSCTGRYMKVYVGKPARQQYAHRLAWLYMTGAWPDRLIDHENGNGCDNRWLNLRPATSVQNLCNAKKRANAKCALKGVSRHGPSWRAQIKVDGKVRSLGVFKTPEDAHQAYCEAAWQHFGEFARVA